MSPHVGQLQCFASLNKDFGIYLHSIFLSPECPQQTITRGIAKASGVNTPQAPDILSKHFCPQQQPLCRALLPCCTAARWCWNEGPGRATLPPAFHPALALELGDPMRSRMCSLVSLCLVTGRRTLTHACSTLIYCHCWPLPY